MGDSVRMAGRCAPAAGGRDCGARLASMQLRTLLVACTAGGILGSRRPGMACDVAQLDEVGDTEVAVAVAAAKGDLEIPPSDTEIAHMDCALSKLRSWLAALPAQQPEEEQDD